MEKLIITLPGDLSENERNLLEDAGVAIVDKRGMDGAVIVDVVLNAATTALSVIAGIAIARIRLREKTSIKIGDIEIRGLSEKRVDELVKLLFTGDPPSGKK